MRKVGIICDISVFFPQLFSPFYMYLPRKVQLWMKKKYKRTVVIYIVKYACRNWLYKMPLYSVTEIVLLSRHTCSCQVCRTVNNLWNRHSLVFQTYFIQLWYMHILVQVQYGSCNIHIQVFTKTYSPVQKNGHNYSYKINNLQNWMDVGMIGSPTKD